MKVAIFGAGGVGGYLGARLATSGHDVHLIARGDHLDALQAEGLHVESIHGDVHVEVPATADPAEIGECDAVLFCVKSYDTRTAAASLSPLLGESTAVVSLQNGVDNERWIAEEIGDKYVVGGVAYIFSTIKHPGVVEHTGGPARFIYGELDNTVTARIEALDEALQACEGLEAVLADDIMVERWRKFVFICAQAGMTAAARASIGQIRDTEPAWAMYKRVMREVVSVAQAKGIAIDEAVVAEWVEFAESLDADVTSSLHYDLTHSKRMELEALNGSVVRHAGQEGVEAPMNDAIYGVLAPSIQQSN